MLPGDNGVSFTLVPEVDKAAAAQAVQDMQDMANGIGDAVNRVNNNLGVGGSAKMSSSELAESNAMSTGSTPTVTLVTTVFVDPDMTETVSEPELAT